MTSKFPRWSNKVANWGDGDFQNFTGVKDKKGAVGRVLMVIQLELISAQTL